MARSAKKYLKISKGQISKNLVERTDIGILDDSGQEITNFYNTKYGALQTVAGTEFMFNFGEDAKVKLHTIHLSDNKEATLAFDATNQKLYLFDYQGNQLDQISFPYITEENYERSNIAQQEELVLLATGDNPLVRIGITNNKLSHSIYTIPAKNVMKVTNVVKPSAEVSVYRTKQEINSQQEANTILPSLDTGWPIGTYVQPNQTEDKPSETFPWSVYQKTDNGWVGPMDFYPSNPILYKNTTPGAYQFTVPGNFTTVEIEYAGAAGGRKWNSDGAGIYPSGVGGKGSIIKQTVSNLENRIISGIIGSKPIQTYEQEYLGGTGYSAGENSNKNSVTVQYVAGGGGGGSTSVVVNNIILEASAGSGASFASGTPLFPNAYGGKGGGTYGGARQTAADADGNNATDPTQVGLNSGNGYIIIIGRTSDTTTIIQNIWDKINYEYNHGWSSISGSTDLEYPNTKFAVSATAGIVNITPKEGNLASITAPAGLDATQYAKSKLIGTNFDSDSAIGVVRITEIEGSASEQTYNITKISGPTIVGFDKVYHKADEDAGIEEDLATGFKITTSMTPALSGALPSTNDNPTGDTNYPNLITFYQQRLIIFGTQYNQEQILFSNIGEYDNFTDDYLSTSAFQLVIGSDQKESIRAFCLNQGIQIFTNVSEWLMDAQTITRTTGFVRNSQMGTNGVKPIISANGTTLFCPKNGKGIIGFIYNEQSASYMTPYISMFTDLLDVEISDLFLKRGRDSQDDTLLYICDADGNLIIGNYLQDHNIQGFCRRSATGVKFLQSVQNEENVLLLSSRAGYTTLERIDQSKKTAHSTSLFQYNQESGVITLELPQYDNTALNVYDETGTFVLQGLVEPNTQPLYAWTEAGTSTVFYTKSETPAIGDTVYIKRVHTDYYYEVADYSDGQLTVYGRPLVQDFDPEILVCTRDQSKDTVEIQGRQITLPEGKRPQYISEIGYNIHQVFHSNPMNIGAITMTEYKSIARIDIALTSESRHDALTINKKYGRRKGNLVSYIRPQRPTRDCTFTIENDVYPVEILSMEVEIEY